MIIEWQTEENTKIMLDLISQERDRASLISFIKESNKIEGIDRDPTQLEIKAHEDLIGLKLPKIEDLIEFVSACEPTAKIRDTKGMNVRVGDRKPINGGQIVVNLLKPMLSCIDVVSPAVFHKKYEELHPFMDCNGRSGRALWYWQMVNIYKRYPDRFLQDYYYQTLSEA